MLSFSVELAPHWLGIVQPYISNFPNSYRLSQHKCLNSVLQLKLLIPAGTKLM